MDPFHQISRLELSMGGQVALVVFTDAIGGAAKWIFQEEILERALDIARPGRCRDQVVGRPCREEQHSLVPMVFGAVECREIRVGDRWRRRDSRTQCPAAIGKRMQVLDSGKRDGRGR